MSQFFLLAFLLFSVSALAGKGRLKPKQDKSAEYENPSSPAITPLNVIAPFMPEANLTAQPAEEEEDFVPSLSQSLSDTKKLKRTINRQLAEELSSVSDKTNATNPNREPQNQLTDFGDFKISISKRTTENFKKVKKNSRRLKKK